MMKSIFIIMWTWKQEDDGYESTFSHMMAQRQPKDIALSTLLQVLLTRLID
jgi:hypothetical protein